MAAAGLIDPTKTGKYPVILGDGLLGKDCEKVFTGIRYNHKPTLSSASAPNHARLKPSLPGKTSSYDLVYDDAGDKYAFTGARNTEKGQYVLYFDPDREAFILDKIDSTFDLNVTRVPGNPSPAALKREFPYIEKPRSNPPPQVKVTEADSKPKLPQKPRNDSPLMKPKKASKPAKPVEKKQPAPPPPPKKMELSLPKPEPMRKPDLPKKPKPAPQPKRRHIEEEEDEDEDDDGGLLVEYPEGDPREARRQTDFSPAFPTVRRFDDFMDQRESEGDDVDGEDLEEAESPFKLPSPVENRSHPSQSQAPSQVHSQQHVQNMYEEEDDDDDFGGELENELEKAFEDLEKESPDDDNESEISEED